MPQHRSAPSPAPPRLYQPDQDGYPLGADDLMKRAYGRIPEATEFQHISGCRVVPEVIHGWHWSVTFGRWTALVTFADGWHGFTFPQPQRQAKR